LRDRHFKDTRQIITPFRREAAPARLDTPDGSGVHIRASREFRRRGDGAMSADFLKPRPRREIGRPASTHAAV
jgi:hypothetical protein